MKLSKEQELKIALTLSRFDFDKVQKAMEAVGWKYSTGNPDGDCTSIPTVDDLYNTAYRLLKDTAKSQSTLSGGFFSASSGGFVATYKNKEFYLVFELGESDSEI